MNKDLEELQTGKPGNSFYGDFSHILDGELNRKALRDYLGGEQDGEDG